MRTPVLQTTKTFFAQPFSLKNVNTDYADKKN